MGTYMLTKNNCGMDIPNFERAVVILANDGVMEWLRACLKSLREVSPDIACLILPFDGQMEATIGLAESLGAIVIQPKGLEELTQIGVEFHPNNRIAQHVFRKICALTLPVKEILFSDADVVFLKPVEPLFDALKGVGEQVLYSDSDMQRVYCDARFAELMVKQHGAKGINTGFWLTGGGNFVLADIRAAAARAAAVAHCFDPRTMEQPFLNYLFDTSGLECVHFSERISGFPWCSWGALPVKRENSEYLCATVHEDVVYNKSTTGLHMLHWAGVPLGWSMANRELFLDKYFLGEPGYRKSLKALTWFFAHFISQAEAFTRRRLRPAKIMWRQVFK